MAVPLYRFTQYFGTVAHEGGHALVAKLLFQAVRAIRFTWSGDGMTYTTPSWPIIIPVAMAGYLGPSAFGLFAAWLLTQGQTETVLWGSLAFLGVMLLVVRGWVGWIIVPALMVLLFEIATDLKPPLQVLFTHVWVWFLLIIGVEQMLVFIQGKVYKNDTSDSVRLQKETHIPSEIWSFVFLCGTIAALVAGGMMLLHLAG
ncbi:MAG: M50 family metallopeptidase [Micromonosporaceae bacterium]|nr:M50 family metallopeptidase [Micromonosporaceae bacterium]